MFVVSDALEGHGEEHGQQAAEVRGEQGREAVVGAGEGRRVLLRQPGEEVEQAPGVGRGEEAVHNLRCLKDPGRQ